MSCLFLLFQRLACGNNVVFVVVGLGRSPSRWQFL